MLSGVFISFLGSVTMGFLGGSLMGSMYLHGIYLGRKGLGLRV